MSAATETPASASGMLEDRDGHRHPRPAQALRPPGRPRRAGSQRAARPGLWLPRARTDRARPPRCACSSGSSDRTPGAIAVLGTPFSWHDRTRMFRIGALIESPTFYPYLSGRDNLRTFAAAGPPTPKDARGRGAGRRRHARPRRRTRSRPTRWACASGWASPRRCCRTRSCCCSTSRPTGSIRPASWPCASCCASSRARARRSSSRATSSRRSQQLADVVGIIDHGRLVREGPTRAPAGGGPAGPRPRAAPEDVAARRGAAGASGHRSPSAVPEGPQAGWVVVRVGDGACRGRQPGRSRARASGPRAIEPTSDLESVFLSLTASAPIGGRIRRTAAGWGMAPPGDVR